MLHRSKADDDPALQRRNFLFFCRAVSTTPSPGPRRLEKAPTHPLPQGGKGGVSISFIAALPRGVVGQFDVEAALRCHMAR